MPTAYPEGSPTHPAYPAGHAAFIGACVTILKAFFDNAAPVASPKVPDGAGDSLVDYVGAPLTVGGELNKLASNVPLGRDAAGVHWRTDGVEGMNLGEYVAITVLHDVRRMYNESFDGFPFRKFDGTTIHI